MLKSTFVFFVFIALSITQSRAQTMVPCFKSKEDSLKYNAILRFYENLDRPPTQWELDSIQKIHQNINMFFKAIYMPSNPEILLDSLLSSTKPDTITAIILSGKSYKQIPKELRKFPNLAYLEIVNTNITKIPRSLRHNPHLKKILIQENNPGKKLKFSKNKSINHATIHTGHENSPTLRIHKLDNLHTLHFYDNELDAIPKKLHKNKNLQELRFTNCYFNTPPSFQKGKKYPIHTLIFSKCKITQTPLNLHGFSALKTLTLNENSIHQVNPGLGALKHLESLSFYKNNLKEIPAQVFELPSLKQIDLYHNEISRIQPEIKNLTNLKILYLSHNKIYSLPSEIGELKNLKELYVHHNKLSYLPETIANLQNLEVLHFNDNLFQDFPMQILKLNSLEDLDFSGNSLEKLPSLNVSFPHLKYLKIDKNPYGKQFLASEEHQNSINSLKSIGIRVFD
jgi:Leucine-rich repeat (LRR) protein